MIAATDLRIGNWITILRQYDQGGNYPYEIAHGHDIEEIEGNGEAVEPIAITLEILEKCGFSKATDSYGGFLSPEINDERWRVRKDEFGYYWQNELSSNPVRFSGLHVLQNWFFALTGNELDYKP